jgi:BirA family biotin operon repressor/biotin-[acetyl-CoA-carboxylase] ligase
MIRHIHLDVCDSTQDVLKEQLHQDSLHERIVVSCENQISGRGRGHNKWTAMPGTLCFSLNIEPNPVMSFTAIELSVILAEYFEKKGFILSLKWPNDLWNAEANKCGGILVQGHQSNLLAGIGINLWSDQEELGGISPTPFPMDKKSLALELAEFIYSERVSDVKLLGHNWLRKCGHLDRKVRIYEGQEVTEGIFSGIGQFGEALINCNGETQKIYNGSLRVV